MQLFGIKKGDWVRVTGKLKIRNIDGKAVAQIAAVDVAESLYYRGNG